MKILVQLPYELLRDASHTHNLFTTYYTTALSFVASSPDYKILTIDEQRSLLKRNLNGLFIFCAEIVCRDLKMLDNPTWIHTLTYTLGSDMIERKRLLNSRLEHDTTLIKLMLIIIAFSSNCYMLDERQTIKNDHLLYGTFRLLGSQNVFVEILWKYMIYRYGYNQSVIKFSRIIQIYICVLKHLEDIYTNNQAHQNMVDCTIENIKQSLIINENEQIPLWGKT